VAGMIGLGLLAVPLKLQTHSTYMIP
jgi:hypothetical protein